MKIGVDVDGVLADFTSSARKLMKELFNKPTENLTQTSWNFSSLGLTGVEEKMLWLIIDTTPNWWLSLKRLDKTTYIDAVDIFHEVFFITNRKPSTGIQVANQTKIWIAKHTRIQYPTVIVTKRKGDLAAALELDYFIDDKPENCIDVWNKSPMTRVFLKGASYNQTCDHTGLTRVDSLDSFLKEIGAIYARRN